MAGNKREAPGRRGGGAATRRLKEVKADSLTRDDASCGTAAQGVCHDCHFIRCRRTRQDISLRRDVVCGLTGRHTKQDMICCGHFLPWGQA